MRGGARGHPGNRYPPLPSQRRIAALGEEPDQPSTSFETWEEQNAYELGRQEVAALCQNNGEDPENDECHLAAVHATSSQSYQDELRSLMSVAEEPENSAETTSEVQPADVSLASMRVEVDDEEEGEEQLCPEQYDEGAEGIIAALHLDAVPEMVAHLNPKAEERQDRF